MQLEKYKIYVLFIGFDATLVEINPFVVAP